MTTKEEGKQKKINKTELYYWLKTPDYDEWGGRDYQSATLDIYEVTPEQREWHDRYFPGDMYVDASSDEVMRLSYQRDRTKDKTGEYTSDPNLKVVSPWYAEDIEHIKRDCFAISSKSVERAAKLLKRMEKISDDIYSKGLTIQYAEDDLKRRVYLLKALGAKELVYSKEDHRLRQLERVYA